MKIKKGFLITAIVVATVLIIISYVIANNKTKPNYDEFAQCLTEKGAVMYGTYWCKYCNMQKKDFGNSFKHINYVECSEEPDECTENEIDGFPTWVIDNVKYEGKQPLEKLSALTKCEINGGE